MFRYKRSGPDKKSREVNCNMTARERSDSAAIIIFKNTIPSELKIRKMDSAKQVQKLDQPPLQADAAVSNIMNHKESILSTRRSPQKSSRNVGNSTFKTKGCLRRSPEQRNTKAILPEKPNQSRASSFNDSSSYAGIRPSSVKARERKDGPYLKRIFGNTSKTKTPTNIFEKLKESHVDSFISELKKVEEEHQDSCSFESESKIWNSSDRPSCSNLRETNACKQEIERKNQLRHDTVKERVVYKENAPPELLSLMGPDYDGRCKCFREKAGEDRRMEYIGPGSSFIDERRTRNRGASGGTPKAINDKDDRITEEKRDQKSERGGGCEVLSADSGGCEIVFKNTNLKESNLDCNIADYVYSHISGPQIEGGTLEFRNSIPSELKVRKYYILYMNTIYCDNSSEVPLIVRRKSFDYKMVYQYRWPCRQADSLTCDRSTICRDSDGRLVFYTDGVPSELKNIDLYSLPARLLCEDCNLQIEEVPKDGCTSVPCTTKEAQHDEQMVEEETVSSLPFVKELNEFCSRMNNRKQAMESTQMDFVKCFGEPSFKPKPVTLDCAHLRTRPLPSSKGPIGTWNSKSLWNRNRICPFAPSCKRCGIPVFVAERMISSGGCFHKICFCCYICGRPLTNLTVQENQGEIFCKSCYAKHFATHGYGFASSSK